MTESILLTLMGGGAGMLGGIAITAAGCIILNVPFAVNWSSLLISAAAAAVIGAAFGAYPAYKAATMKPVDALRM